MKNAPLQTFFLFMHLCKHFFFEMQTVFLHISSLQAICFVFLGPANNFFYIFHIHLQKNNSPSLIQQYICAITAATSKFVLISV